MSCLKSTGFFLECVDDYSILQLQDLKKQFRKRERETQRETERETDRERERERERES